MSHNEEKDQKSWFLDTGASNQLIGKKGLFVPVDESFKQNISFRDERKVQDEGTDNILILAKIGTH